MSGVSPLTWMLLIWGTITAVFVVLMIYRSLVAMREDDQLFLDPAESKMQEEQNEVQRKMNRLTPYTKGFGFASAGLLVVIAGLWVYQALTRFNAPP
ncbi:MAG TPA: hypothetical protein VLW25_14900 [Bryobacteraceae bacterium]|nr:hypothetical protein [Bryobacteraceae bacterium]HUJ51496.1 hypothetical protein [Bryobacteraceae bacterium]